MKILFIGEINKNDGSSKRMVPLLSYVAGKGHEVVLITNSDDYNYLHNHIENVKIYKLCAKYPFKNSRNFRMRGIERELILSINALILTINTLKKFNADVIYGFNPIAYSGGVGLICSKIFKKPFVLELSDLTWEWGNVKQSNANKVAIKFYKSIQKKVVKQANRIIATPFIKDYCISIGINANKIDVIPCGADINFFNKSVDYNDIVRKYGLEGFNVITYTGSLYKAFGISDLIDAVYLVIKKHENTKLVLVGNYIKEDMDGFKDKVEKYGIKDNVIFVELQPYSEIPKFMNASDICVNPFPGSSVCRAGSPVKVFEYMLCGKPVVHSDLECVEDVVIDGKTGLLYEADNVQDLANKLNILIESPELRKQLGDAAEKLILEKYTWDKLGNQLIDSFTNINDTNNIE
jgi:glycosyltransferase involved in cell wall biosynthesis